MNRIQVALALGVLACVVCVGCAGEKSPATGEGKKHQSDGSPQDAGKAPEPAGAGASEVKATPEANSPAPKVATAKPEPREGPTEAAAAPETAAAPEAAAPVPEAAAAAPKQITVTVGDMPLDADLPAGSVDVAFTLPAGWAEAPAYGENRWGPAGVELAFGFDVSCNGSCHPAAIAGNMTRSFEGFRSSAARPNVNTGDPAMDALRANVETLEEAELPGGRLLALRVTYAREILASGPYRPQLRLLCAWRNPGDAWYVSLRLLADLEPGEAALPALLEICRSVKVKGPTPTEAEKQGPLTLEGSTCTLDQLPADSYTVDSANSEGKPSVILFNRPVVIGGLPLAPIGRVYLEYNDDPISLRDIFTAADHTFTVGATKITCLRRRPLSITGNCELRRCTLASDAQFDGVTIPAYSEITLDSEVPGKLKRVNVPAGAKGTGAEEK